MGLRIESGRQGKIAAEGEAVIVMIDYRVNRKVGLPDQLRRRIELLEAG